MNEITQTLQLGSITSGLLGGLAIFLFGMERMTDSLKTIAGGGIKKLLAALTTNRFSAAFIGAFVTAVIQSSSVTTVLVVGFISAGVLTLPQSIGIIMGANIGTTITAQVIAFKIAQYGLLMIAIGVGLRFFSQQENVQRTGSVVMALGLVFFGMEIMSEATGPLRTYPPFIELMARMENPFLGVLVGAVFTALVQSSSATTGLVIMLASQGFVTLPAGIALALGANIGTCVTAALSSVGKPRAAKQAVLVHVLFNVLGVLVWFGFISQLAWLAQWISPASPSLQGLARLAAETPRQIANANTIFNVANALLFIGFTKPVAAFVERLLPEEPVTEPEPMQPKYLDEVFLETPSLALDRVRLELHHVGEKALHMVRDSAPAVMRGTQADLDAIARMDDDVDRLYEAILTYIGNLSRKELTEGESEQLQRYVAVANYIENIGDSIETNMAAIGRERLASHVEWSDAAQRDIRPLFDKVCWAVEQSMQALQEWDSRQAEAVIDAKPQIDRLSQQVYASLTSRLATREPARFSAYRTESDTIEVLKRLYYFAKRIAKEISGQPVASPGRLAA